MKMSHRATLSDLIDALTQNMTTVDIAQTALHIELSQKIRTVSYTHLRAHET